MNNACRFSVIIPVHNKWELTANCLRSLREHDRRQDFEVIVADNGSQDATAAELPLLGEALFGTRFRRLRFEENRNFGPACNAGAGAALSPFLFFLNNDTLLTPGWSEPLLEAFDKTPSLGGAGPLLLYEDNTVQHLGVVFSVFRVEHLYRGLPAAHPLARKTRRLQVHTAAALMLPRELFFHAGAFCEEYRNGFEDVDLCLRISATGKHFSCISASRVYHLESRTPGRKDDDKHNGAVLQRRCMDLWHADKHLHGLRDGLVPRINDRLDIDLDLAPKEKERLAACAAGADTAALLRLVGDNPFWSEGMDRLAALLESQARFEEALYFRGESAFYQADMASAKRYMQAAAKADNAEALAEAQDMLRAMTADRGDKELVRRALRLAAKWRDSFLEGLYREKRQELFP